MHFLLLFSVQSGTAPSGYSFSSLVLETDRAFVQPVSLVAGTYPLNFTVRGNPLPPGTILSCLIAGV